MKRTYYIENETERDQLFNRMITKEVTKPWQVVVSFIESVSSTKQKRLYWMWVQEIIDHVRLHMGVSKTKLEIDAWLLDLFAPTLQSEFRGKSFMIVTTVSNMSQKQMRKYLMDIELFCPTELELVLTHPPDLYDAA